MLSKFVNSQIILRPKTFRCPSILLFLCLICIQQWAHAFYIGPVPNDAFKHGHVIARSVVIDPDTNEPILVEYNTDGSEAGKVNIGANSVTDLVVTPAANFRFFKQQLEEYQELYPDAELMSRNQYESTTFKAADNETNITRKPNTLPTGIHSVLVLGQSSRFLDTQGELARELILLQFSLDMTQENSGITENTKTLVVDADGQIISHSEKNIGYRVGFYGDPKEAQSDSDLSIRIDKDDEVFGPVKGTAVSVNPWIYPGGIDITGDRGNYAFRFIMPPCPPGGWIYQTDVEVELRYKNFLPIGSPSIPYYVRTPSSDYCYATVIPITSLGSAAAAISVIATLATSSIPYHQTNLYVDVMFLTGLISLRNLDGSNVAIGDTTYTSFDSPADKRTQNYYDFNGDNELDIVYQGRIEEITDEDGNDIKQFIIDENNGDLQGVYFSEPEPEEEGVLPEPDIVRLIDEEIRDEPIGVLKSISHSDLRNTDILFFRESTGELIMERRGLKEAESVDVGDIELDEAKNQVAYRVMLRGPSDSNYNIGAINRGYYNRYISYKEWATDYQMEEPFINVQSDHLRSGEYVKIVAINRATGYTGTARVQLTSIADNPISGLSVVVPPITLVPPNLKIWAEREYDVEAGLTQGEERKYVIGAEGASTTDDKLINLFTEWLDENGEPLPEGLGVGDGEDYGLTGRLAKVVSNNQLGVTSNNDLAQFAISPGRKTQIIRANSNLSSAEHFYIHVIGKAKDQQCLNGATCPSFDNTDNDGRPGLRTPFLVPLADEDQHWQEYNNYRQILREQEDNNQNTENELTKPLPAYSWQVRPEYQFSQYDLEIQEINRTYTDENGNEEELDIYDQENPLVASSDDLITALYSLVSNQYDRLTPVDGVQQLVFAFGEEEQEITIGEDQTITFDNIDHLSSLDPEDFLTMRLYTNNDVGNILWEYAFLYLDLGIHDDKGAIVGNDLVLVSADQPTIDLATVLVGYSSLDDKTKENMPNAVVWRIIEGMGEISGQAIEMNDAGTTINTLSVEPNVGNLVRVEAVLVGDDTAIVKSFDIGVIAGKPTNIVTSNSGQAYVQQRGQVEVTATLRDQHNNLVENGTGVDFKPSSSLKLLSSTGLTDNGSVTATLTGEHVSGTYDLKVSAGEAIVETSVTIQSIATTITNIPANMTAASSYTMVAKINQNIPGSKEGLYIDIGSNAGTIFLDDTSTDENGEMRFRFMPSTQTGSYQLSTKLDRKQPNTQSVSTNPSPTNFIGDTTKFIVGPNTKTSKDYRGSTINITSTTSTTFEINGEAEEEWQVDLNNKHFINRDPLYFSRFVTLGWDQLREVKAEFENIERRESPYPGLYALGFADSDSYWAVNTESIQTINQPSYNFWVKPSSSGEILSVAGGAIQLNLNNTTLTASVNISSNSEHAPPQLQANVDNIVAGQWYQIALGMNDDIFYLAVDQHESIVPMEGATINYSGNNITLGAGFAGDIAGLRVYDWNSTPIFSLSETEGNYDLEGNAQVTLAVANSTQQNGIRQPAVSVIISHNNKQVLLTAINRDTANALGAAYSGVYNQNNPNITQLTTSMPMDAWFPDPKIAASSLAQRVVAENNNTPSIEDNTIAALGLISHDLKYEDLHQYIPDLQAYFIDSDHTNLAKYGVAYLQEAAIQSANGRDFWLRSLSTSLAVWSELLEVRPDIATVIADNVQSEADFWTWVRVLSLPANGWESNIIPIPRYHMTCDKVPVDTNEGTLLEFSSTPCRATGAQMAAMLAVIIDNDPSISSEPGLLTTYLLTMINSLKQAPIEYKRLFPSMESSVAANSLYGIQNAEAAIWFYAIRGLAIAIKQAIRKGAGGAPANFVAFMQGGTTSRIEPVEMLATLAYLGSRLEGGPFCESGAKCFNTQISDTIISDIGVWFAGIGLAKKGKFASELDQRRSCTITNGAHGKGFELLVTAAYQALYEFGGDLGLGSEKAQEYEILLSDPRTKEDTIEVPIMYKDGRKYEHYDGSPHQRKPDLILAGKGEGQRHWIELKSWMYKKKYLKSNNKLNFDLWSGHSKTKKGFSRSSAQRQHFLDYVATTDALLDEYWREEVDEDIRKLKPSAHTTYIQVWKSGKRSWRPLTKNGSKYTLGKKEETVNVATPWIDTNSIVASTTTQFKALQEYLTSPPATLRSTTFKDTTGISETAYKSEYQKRQISNNVAELESSTVQPFNLLHFLTTEAGKGAAEKLLKRIFSEFGNENFADIQTAIQNGDLTEERLDELREEITDKMLELLGPWKYLAVDIPLLSDIENAIVDTILGDEVEELRSSAANMTLSETLFENACEAR